MKSAEAGATTIASACRDRSVCSYGFSERSYARQDAIAIRLVLQDPRSPLNDLKTGGGEQLDQGGLGKPPYVSPVHETGILISETPGVQSRLHAPVLRIGNAR